MAVRSELHAGRWRIPGLGGRAGPGACEELFFDKESAARRSDGDAVWSATFAIKAAVAWALVRRGAACGCTSTGSITRIGWGTDSPVPTPSMRWRPAPAAAMIADDRGPDPPAPIELDVFEREGDSPSFPAARRSALAKGTKRSSTSTIWNPHHRAALDLTINRARAEMRRFPHAMPADRGSLSVASSD